MAAWTDREIELIAERAYQLHLQGRNQDAFVIFEGLLAIDPQNVYCLQALASLYLMFDAPQKAVEYASQALAFSPGHIEALACRCEAYLRLKQFGAAQQDLELLKRSYAPAYVAQLTMRMTSAKRFSTNWLLDATTPELER